MAGGQVSTLVVQILGDSTGATAAIGATSAATNAIAEDTGNAGRSMAGVWTTVAAGMAMCVKASSDLEQATGALEAIYGENADAMLEWAESMSVYGLSTAQAANAAAVLGSQLLNLGVPMDMTIQLVQGMTVTAANMAAVYGGTVPQALQAMSSALKGNYEMLDNYAISVTAATVQAEALRLAEMGVTFASEEQAKALSALSLIQQQTTAVQGAAEAEQDSLAASTQRLIAEVTNLAAQLGGALSPAISGVIGATASLVGGFSNAITESEILIQITAAVTSVMDSLADILGPVLTPILEVVELLLGNIAKVLEVTLVPALELLNRALQPIVGIMEAISASISTLINWFEQLIDTIFECVDALTFWNDTYESSSAPSGMSMAFAPIPTIQTRRGFQRTAPTINVTVNAGIGDPHAIATEIRKVLVRDNNRLGRFA